MAARRVSPEGGVPFGRYLLRERIAQGGMGEVFRAIAIGASGFEKPVVVKRILPQLQSEQRLATMFVDEARLMSRLAHPNIVQVIDFGQGAAEDYFLVLELVEGVDLGRLRDFYQGRSERVPIPLALYVVQQMLRGLGHAHEKAYDDGRVLVHRDVSPGNVLLSTVGEVKIGDFGVALAGAPDESAGAARLVVGKLGYMAPEQHAGEPVDPRADLFSVGVVLFELLTHERPFAGQTPAQRQSAAALGRSRSARELRAEISPELDALVAKALSRSPDGRFRTARAMASAVEELRGANHSMASADELAEAVELARAASPHPSKPVVLLGADPAAREEAVGELTRTGAAQFTMNLAEDRTAAPPALDEANAQDERDGGAPSGAFPSTILGSDRVDRGRPTVPEGKRLDGRGTTSRSAGRAWLAALAAVGAVSTTVVWLASRPSATEPGATEPRASATMGPDRAREPTGGARADVAGSSDQGRGEPHLSSSAPESSRPPPPARSAASAAAAADTGAAPAGRSSSPAASASAATSLVAASCQGEVHLFASHGWSVSGGPSTVQAPGRYRWPCGSYALRALSRLDPSESRQLSATVQQGQVVVLDLRR